MLSESIPLISRLRRQLPPKGKPLEKTDGSASDQKPFPGRGRCREAADEVEDIPPPQSEWLYRQPERSAFAERYFLLCMKEIKISGRRSNHYGVTAP